MEDDPAAQADPPSRLSRDDGEDRIVAALDFLRGILRGGGETHWKADARRQKGCLEEWAKNLGCLLIPESILPRLKRGGQEHDYFLDDETDRCVKVTRNGVFGLSPGIELALVPADQDARGVERIVLDIAPQQVIGQPLFGPPRILIYDVGDTLRYDYSLFINPIRLTATNGGMLPSLLVDPTWCDSGIIDLAANGVRYVGPSGVVAIQAANDSGVTSNRPEISFNGYDILKVFDFKGDSLTHLFSGYPITARVAVRHGGSDLTVTASLGVAHVNFGEAPVDATEFIRRADGRLYDAKREGRNRVEITF